MHYWLFTVHLFAFWPVCLSSYHVTDRPVDWMTDDLCLFVWLVSGCLSLHWPFAFAGGLLTDCYGNYTGVRYKLLKTYNDFKPSLHGCSSYRQTSPMIEVAGQFLQNTSLGYMILFPILIYMDVHIPIPSSAVQFSFSCWQSLWDAILVVCNCWEGQGNGCVFVCVRLFDSIVQVTDDYA